MDINYIIKLIEEKIKLPIQKYKIIDEGVMNYTFNIYTQLNEYILKINPIGREKIAMKEATAIAICNNSFGIKVPNILYTYQAETNYTNSFIVYEKLKGRSLSNSFNLLKGPELKNIYYQIINNFEKISSISLDSSGETIDFKIFTNTSWNDFLGSECELSMNFLSKNKLLKNYELNRLYSYINKEISLIELDQNKFVWTDFDPSNIIIDHHNNLSGFIDFEGVIGGDPSYAVGSLLAKFGYNEFSNYIISELCLNRRKLEFYAVVRYLRLIKFSKLKLPTGKERDNINIFLPFAAHLMKNIY